MFSPVRWKRANLIIAMALLLTVSFCCPVLMAIDDEDNDLPPVILPLHKPGGGGGGGGEENNRVGIDSPFPPTYGSRGEFGIITNVSVVFEAAVRMIPVLTCDDIPGLRVSGRDQFVNMTLTMVGSGATPDNPDARISVTAPAGEHLRVMVDDATFLVRNNYAFGTTLDEIFAGLFQFDLNSGFEVISGRVCIIRSDLSDIGVDELHRAVLDGRIESKFSLPNDGSADLDELIKLAAEDLRNEVFDLGVIQIGYDAGGNVVSLSNVIVSADPYAGYGCPVEVKVFTLD